MKTQIFCNNCNASLYEDTKFCPECGAKVEPQDNIEQETVFCPNCGTSTSMESEFCSECGKAIYQEAGKDTISIDETQKKKAVVPFKFKVKPLYIGIAAAIFLIAIFGFVAGKGGSNAQNGIIYAKDNELQFMYLSKLNTFEMTDKLNNDSYTLTADDYLELSDYILTSNDGRYIFYPDRIEDGLSYYWRDLKADNIKNDAAVKIDSNISDQLFLDGSGNKFFYIKDDNNRLYVFDRKSGEKNKLDEEVIDFYVNEEGNYIIYSKFIDNEYFIYEMTLSGITGEKNKIDSNAKIQRISTDEKRIYYIKDDALYHKESGKDKVKIASDVYQFVSAVDSKSVYYIKTSDVVEKLSAFIKDDMIESDKNLTSPVMEAIEPQPSYPSEYDYKHEVWNKSYLGNEYNNETDEYGYWYTETDYEAYNQAYDEYQEIYEIWKEKDDAVTEKYYKEYDVYSGKENRDYLRLEFEDEDNAVTYQEYSLYYWNNGIETLVATDLSNDSNYQYYLATSSRSPIVIYQKYSKSTDEAQKMSEIISEFGNYVSRDYIISNIADRISSLRNTSEEIYVASGDKESIVESSKSHDWTISDNGKIYFLDNFNSEKDYGTLMSATIKNGVVEKPVKVDDDVMDFFPGNENGNYYYLKDVKDYIGDLYLNGKSIATDLYTFSLYNYKGTNTLLYQTDFSYNSYNGNLCINKDGKETKIADDVSYFSPIDEKNVAFLTDYSQNKGKGELKLYDGANKPKLIDSDITAVLWKSNMRWWFY